MIGLLPTRTTSDMDHNDREINGDVSYPTMDSDNTTVSKSMNQLQYGAFQLLRRSVVVDLTM